MAWTGVITNAGNALLSQWASEKTLHIDSAAAGTNRVSVATLMAQTTLASQKQTASIISGEQLAAGYKVKLQITAPDAGYNLSQYGIWGRLYAARPVPERQGYPDSEQGRFPRLRLHFLRAPGL